MCKECGCQKTMVGKAAGKLDGKPTATPTGLYKGIGGSLKWPKKGK